MTSRSWVAAVPMPPQYVGKCTCGWRGNLRYSKDTAMTEATVHRIICPDKDKQDDDTIRYLGESRR